MTYAIQGRSQDFILTEAKGYTGGLGAEPPEGGGLGRSPQRSPGAEPLVGGQGTKPL